MAATVIAPLSNISLNISGKSFYGAILGYTVEVHQDTLVQYIPFNGVWQP